MIKPRSLFAALAATTIIIAGCSAESTDYEKKAEETINDSADYEKADCVKPESTKVGTTFDCTATVTVDQTTAEFIATIDKKNSLIVSPISPGDVTTETTVAADDGTTETTEA